MKGKNIIYKPKGVVGKLKVLVAKTKKMKSAYRANEKRRGYHNKKIVAVAKRKENINKKLVDKVKDLKGDTKKMGVVAKKRENIKKKLVVKVKALHNKTKKLSTVAKKKETVRKKLAVTMKAEQELKTIDEAMLSSIIEGLIAVDRQGRIVAMSKATEVILGWPINELKGKVLYDFVNLIDDKKQVIPKEKRPLNLALTTGKNVITSEYSYVKKDGTSFPVSIFAAPIMLKGKIIGSIDNFQDITKDKQMDKAKDEFISLASHQLKSPITSISWNMESLIDGRKGPLNEGQKQIADEVYNSIRNMSELVNAFLDVTKMEFSSFAAEKGDVDLLHISDSVLVELAGQISAKKINIKKKYGAGVPHLDIGTKTARVIFQNLISNAVKYTAPGGMVEVKIGKSDEGISISIKDNGYGIAEKDKTKIFTKLFRAENIKEKEPSGTGLGLYLLKNLVEKIGGKVWFESKEGTGTTFFVNLK